MASTRILAATALAASVLGDILHVAAWALAQAARRRSAPPREVEVVELPRQQRTRIEDDVPLDLEGVAGLEAFMRTRGNT